MESLKSTFSVLSTQASHSFSHILRIQWCGISLSKESAIAQTRTKSYVETMAMGLQSLCMSFVTYPPPPIWHLQPAQQSGNSRNCSDNGQHSPISNDVSQASKSHKRQAPTIPKGHSHYTAVSYTNKFCDQHEYCHARSTWLRKKTIADFIRFLSKYARCDWSIIGQYSPVRLAFVAKLFEAHRQVFLTFTAKRSLKVFTFCFYT